MRLAFCSLLCIGMQVNSLTLMVRIRALLGHLPMFLLMSLAASLPTKESQYLSAVLANQHGRLIAQRMSKLLLVA